MNKLSKINWHLKCEFAKTQSKTDKHSQLWPKVNKRFNSFLKWNHLGRAEKLNSFFKSSFLLCSPASQVLNWTSCALFCCITVTSTTMEKSRKTSWLCVWESSHSHSRTPCYCETTFCACEVVYGEVLWLPTGLSDCWVYLVCEDDTIKILLIRLRVVFERCLATKFALSMLAKTDI